MTPDRAAIARLVVIAAVAGFDRVAAVGGTHEDWMELDQVMAKERHTAVLIRVARIYSNPG